MWKIDERAIELWQVDLYSLGMIGEFFGITRQAVKAYLNRRGISTSDLKKVEVNCHFCKEPVMKYRSHIRNARYPYCSLPCYHEQLARLDYTEQRDTQRDARRSLHGLYMPTYLNAIHFIDGDFKNNDPNNLIVFENHGARRRWERAGEIKSGVIPLWPEYIKKKALKVREKSYGSKRR